MAKQPRHRYAVGIDLGTSNCALAYIDLREKDATTRILDIPQWTAPDRADVSRLLPSFAYYPETFPKAASAGPTPPAPAGGISGGPSPAAQADPAGATDAEGPADRGASPWGGRQVVGLWARDVSAREPGRVISSAKSWLAHAGVDRRARLLPWTSRAIPEADKLSPVEASALYLGYLREVWDQAMSGDDGRGALVRQHVTITVPASFDQAAQKLTLEAAQLAGYPAQVRLLEEPQAAFHAWLELHPEEGALERALVGPGAPGHAAQAAAPATPGDSDRRAIPEGPSQEAAAPAQSPGADAPGPDAGPAPRRVLVCDIGGGTTDFSLFSVAFRPDGGAQIRREAVSDHILLGGDNIDLALARILEVSAGGDRLDPAAWQRLVAEARALKERALGERGAAPGGNGEDTFPGAGRERVFRVGVSGAGGNLFAQARTASVTAGQIEELVDEGFFPEVEAADRPRSAAGLREMGLPYAADTAVTRHLARFLALGPSRRGSRGTTVKSGPEASHGFSEPVDAVLFNGGALTPAYLQRRLLHLIGTWQGHPPTALENRELDLAVARGAACHGRDLALGLRPRISGGAARSYYLEAAPPGAAAGTGSLTAPAGDSGSRPGSLYLLCILPMGAETEQVQRIEKLDLRLTVNAPVEFRLYEAPRRPQDRAGNIVRHVPGEFRELPPLRTVARLDAARAKGLGASAETPVTLQARLDALGLLQVHLLSAHKAIQPPERWELHFEMRVVRSRDDDADAPEPVPEEKMPPEIKEASGALLGSHFAPGLLRKLEEAAGRKKNAWPRNWLRQFWEALQPGMFRRDLSPEYETAWLNAAGFFLRPGFGVVLDDYRIDQLWQVHALGPAHPRNKGVRDQYWLLWRRVAGGLSADRQKALFEEARPLLLNPAKPADEAAGMAGSFERLPGRDKEALLDLLLESARARQGQHLAHVFGALGRLLSRVPLHAGEEHVLPPQAVEKAFAFFRDWDWADSRNASLAVLFSQACRVTGHRAVDLPESLRSAVAEKLRTAKAQPRLVRPVMEFLPVEREDLDQLFGEPLPLGLAIGRFS
jgi:hypothetical protein